MPKIDSDIAAIKETLRYIQRDIQEIKTSLTKTDDRITKAENDVTAINQKLSIMTVFSNVLAIILSGVVYFLKGGRE